MNTTPHPPRAVWVDTARSLAMLPILWLHAGDAPDVLSRPVGGAICLFFILAGYFMPRQAGACAKRAAKLALAWLLWSLISWGLYCLAPSEKNWTWPQVFGWGTAALNTPLWFLRNLFLYQLIFAGLIRLHLLPRYDWLWLALLAGCCYAAEPDQHECLRFDWMIALALGFCLRRFDLESLRERLVRNALPLLLLTVLWYTQWHIYPDWLRAHGLTSHQCGLPLAALTWALFYILPSIAAERYFPRTAAILAMGGEGMIFCYAAHSLIYAPLYAYDIHVLWNIWAPPLVLPMLITVQRHLYARAPRLACLLCAK